MARHSACPWECICIEFHDGRTFFPVFSVTGIQLLHQLCNKGFHRCFHRYLHSDPQNRKRREGQQKSRPTGRVKEVEQGDVGGPDEGQFWTYNEVNSGAGTAYVAHIANS